MAPSQVTPKNITPNATTTPPPELAITGPPAAQAPQGADKIKIDIGTVEVDGALPDLTAETEKLVAPYRGRTKTVADFYNLAAAIEQAYNQAGYILVRIVVPPQKLNDGGTFRLHLIDGFIEAVDFSHVPAAVVGPIAARLHRLVGLRHPKFAEIERALLLAGTLPGVTLKSTLAAGKEPGGVRLIIQANYTPFNATVSADDSLGPLFNDWEINVEASANSLLGLGEQIYVYLSGSPQLWRALDGDAKRRVAGTGISIPIGDDGLVATVEGTVADTKPGVPGALFQSNGLFKRLDGKLNYPLIKSRSESLTVAGAFEYSVQTEVAQGFNVLLDEDRLNVLRLSLDWGRGLGEGGSLKLFGQVSEGVSWLNVRTISDVAATNIGFSRFGASPNFSKAELRLAYANSDLPYGAALSVLLHGQFAFNEAMPSSEMFSLDGTDAVSSLTDGSVSGDNGVTGRLELSRPFAWYDFPCAPYLFVSGGRIVNKYDIPGTVLGAVAWGAGLRLGHAPVEGLTPQLSLEFGHVDAGVASANRVMVNLGLSL
ncbi:MAG: ShlB/FhaC/HecB family hemolysin secretion/activation protein [Alphaproteobacteria bacterium]|nr:ShlB/FhaC/HecB family hemolysin secretion/activation protein [Alphaproteobacteria bacterium]MDE1987351.1 ShlB/FhaC/HecB family hemolysin secretion/activation protein [Alphaproteobacteria bacterium]MDE2500193.1 ShlB/FhaC/HecB family hemolysin secretion/activation protein [Alphaproteobacteria bacterium]